VAIEFMDKIFADLHKKKLLILGAGETSELTTKIITEKGIGELFIVNRSVENSKILAEKYHGKVVPYEDLYKKLADVDMLISSVSANEPVITYNQIKNVAVQRGTRPLLLIDMGVPRNIDPTIKRIENVFLEDIDALDSIAKENLAQRIQEIPKAQTIIEEELKNIVSWHQSLEVTPTIRLLREKLEMIRKEEIEKMRNRLSPDDVEKVDLLTKSIINKILHTPTIKIKESSNGNASIERNKIVQFIRYCFGLESAKSEDTRHKDE
jgi:glutamyl-tRNA reductase